MLQEASGPSVYRLHYFRLQLLRHLRVCVCVCVRVCVDVDVCGCAGVYACR